MRTVVYKPRRKSMEACWRGFEAGNVCSIKVETMDKVPIEGAPAEDLVEARQQMRELGHVHCDGIVELWIENIIESCGDLS